MKKTILILILFISTLFANSEVVIFDKKIFEKYLNWENLKNKEKNEITFDSYNSGKSATNCIEYLKYYKDYLPATTIDYQIQSEYIDCEIISQIIDNKVMYQEKSDVNYANYLYKFVNIKSFPNSLNARFNKTFVTLNEIFKKLNIRNNLLLKIEEKEWLYNFEVIGIKINENKKFLLVYFTDKSLKSTYFANSFLVLEYK